MGSRSLTSDSLLTSSALFLTASANSSNTFISSLPDQDGGDGAMISSFLAHNALANSTSSSVVTDLEHSSMPSAVALAAAGLLTSTAQMVTADGEELGVVDGILISNDLNEESNGLLDPQIQRLGQIAYQMVAPVIISFGVLSNLLNLFVLSRPTLRGPTFRYLKWLAVANLLVCVILLPFTMHSHATPVPYLAAFYLAHVEVPVGNALIASSVFIVVGLSIDRFVAVCYPRKYRNLYSHYVATVRIAMSFVVAFIIYIPMTFNKKVVQASHGLYLPEDNLAVSSTTLFTAYTYLLEVCARVAPAILLAVLNTWIIVEFKRISRRRKLLSKGFEFTEVSGYPSPSVNEPSQALPPSGTEKADRRDIDDDEQLENGVCLTTNDRTAHENLSKDNSAYERHELDQCVERIAHDKHELFDVVRYHTSGKEVDDGEHSATSNSIKIHQNGSSRPPISCYSVNEVCTGTDDSNNFEVNRELVSPQRPTSCEISPNLSSTHTIDESIYCDGEGSSLLRPVGTVRFAQNFPSIGNEEDSLSNHLTKDILITIPEPASDEDTYNVNDARGALLNKFTNNGSGPNGEMGIAMISVKPSIRQMSSSALRKVERRHDRERRLVLLLVAIIVAFFVTNIPSAILSVTYSDKNRNHLGFQVFRAVANNLEFLNFGLSFVLYFLFSKDIRGVFVTILKRAARTVAKTLSGGHSSSSKQYDK